MNFRVLFAGLALILGTSAAQAECVTVHTAGGGTQTRCNSVNNQTNTVSSDAIRNLYLSVLNREPDSGGYAFWVQAMNQGHSLSSIRSAFAYSAESQNNVANLYRSLLGREPDSGGFNYWLSALANGASYQAVRNAFLGSAEYRSRH